MLLRGAVSAKKVRDANFAMSVCLDFNLVNSLSLWYCFNDSNFFVSILVSLLSCLYSAVSWLHKGGGDQKRNRSTATPLSSLPLAI